MPIARPYTSICMDKTICFLLIYYPNLAIVRIYRYASSYACPGAACCKRRVTARGAKARATRSRTAAGITQVRPAERATYREPPSAQVRKHATAKRRALQAAPSRSVAAPQRVPTTENAGAKTWTAAKAWGDKWRLGARAIARRIRGARLPSPFLADDARVHPRAPPD
eukprot:IDg17695t1